MRKRFPTEKASPRDEIRGQIASVIYSEANSQKILKKLESIDMVSRISLRAPEVST